KALKAKRFRVVRGTDASGGWVSAEKGYLREVGNLLFHLSLVGILAGFAIKGYYGYQGKVLVTEGEGFTNIVQNYDDKNFGGGVVGEEAEDRHAEQPAQRRRGEPLPGQPRLRAGHRGEGRHRQGGLQRAGAVLRGRRDVQVLRHAAPRLRDEDRRREAGRLRH